MFDSPPEIIPENLTAQEYLYLGKWYCEKQNYDLARTALQRAIETEPGSVTATESKRFAAQHIPSCSVPKEVFKRIAKLQLDAIMNPRGAVDECRSITEEYPDFDRAHTALGSVLLRAASFQEAISSLKRAETLTPERLENLLFLAEAHIIVMDYDAAQAYLNKIAALLAGRVETGTPERNNHQEQFDQLGRSLQILVALG